MPHLPDFLTHYARGEPFRSITAVEPGLWPQVVAGLTEATTWGLDRFADPDYLPRRLEVEAWMRDEFVALGGRPRVEHPSYWLLGRNSRWERQPAAGLRAYMLPLASVAEECLSFTFGDSLLCYHPANRELATKFGRFLHPLGGRLHRLGGLLAEIDRLGAECSAEALQSDHLSHIEAHLWDAPPAVTSRA